MLESGTGWLWLLEGAHREMVRSLVGDQDERFEWNKGGITGRHATLTGKTTVGERALRTGESTTRGRKGSLRGDYGIKKMGRQCIRCLPQSWSCMILIEAPKDLCVHGDGSPRYLTIKTSKPGCPFPFLASLDSRHKAAVRVPALVLLSPRRSQQTLHDLLLVWVPPGCGGKKTGLSSDRELMLSGAKERYIIIIYLPSSFFSR